LCKAEDEFLDAYVMINEIVVLVPSQKFNTADIKEVVWSEFDRPVGEMHGKRKKGAPKVKSDSSICEIHYKDGSVSVLKTPVGGQLIELNENIITNTDILSSNDAYNGGRYVAIVYPNTKLPGPLDTDVEAWKRKQHEASMVPRICYSFLEGTCTRGDACRFQHGNVSGETTPVLEVTDDTTAK
jgi:hypothetical protein